MNASLAAGGLGDDDAPFGVVARTLGGLATELTDLLAFHMRVMLDLVSDAHEQLVRFDRATRTLASRLQRVRSVAVAEARFVGTNALVEAARVSGVGNDLGPLAEQIDAVADEVAERASRACARMDLVRELAAQLLAMINRESSRDEEGT